jgi:hypothetical protein
MVPFTEWLTHCDTTARLRLLENAEFFNPQGYNPVFNAELEKLADTQTPDVRKQLMGLRGFDWGGYIERSLKRAGFRDDDDLQEQFHAIVVRLLVNPGKLFQGWNVHRHGPLERRFGNAVWNAIRNIVEKRRNRRKWTTTADPAMMDERNPARRPYSGALDAFRELVGMKLGPLALAILDWRLQGEDTKDLVGRPELGSPSVWRIKQEVQAIKQLAQRFAAQSGDVEFLNRIDTAMEREAETVARRQAGRKAWS